MKAKKIALVASLAAYTAFGLSGSALAAQQKDFVWYCESEEATAEQKKTVQKIYAESGRDPEKISCQEFMDETKKLSSYVIAFEDTDLTDFSPLAGFDNLRKVFCAPCNSDAIATIPPLPNLIELTIPANYLERIPDLWRFPKLEILDVGENPIRHVHEVDQLKNLKSLFIHQTRIQDLKFLSQLPNLTKLEASSLPKGAINTLPKLPNLSYFGAASNHIESIDIIRKTPNVVVLGLYSNEIEKFDGIEVLSRLKVLGIGDNNFKKIPRGSIPKSVTGIYLNGNSLEDFEFIKDLKGTTQLDLENTGFSDWSLIDHLRPSLIALYLSNNPLPNKSIPQNEREQWPKLEHFEIVNDDVTSLAFFKQFEAPSLYSIEVPYFENKTEENCPTTGVPKPVADFCQDKQY